MEKRGIGFGRKNIRKKRSWKGEKEKENEKVGMKNGERRKRYPTGRKGGKGGNWKGGNGKDEEMD